MTVLLNDTKDEQTKAWIQAIPHGVVWAVLLYAVSVVTGASLGPDKSSQLGSAVALVHGYGYSLPEWHAKSGETVWEASNAWPPGYSAFVACMVKGGLSVWAGALAVDVVCGGLFFAAASCLASVLVRRTKERTGLWVYWTWAASPISLLTLTSSDIMALAFFTLSLALMVASVRGEMSWGRAALAGFSAGFAALTRWAYLPLLAVVPLALTFVGHSSFRWKVSRALAFVAAGIPLPMLWILRNRAATGQATFLSDAGLAGGLRFPENLLFFSPFPAVAVGADHAIGSITKRFPSVENWTIGALWLVSGFLVLVIVLGSRSRPRAKREEIAGQDDAERFLWTAGVVTAALTCAMLGWLSLTHPLQYWPGNDSGWTCVGEGRYFAPIFSYIGCAIVWALGRLFRSDVRAARAIGIVGIVILTSVGLTTLARRTKMALSGGAVAISQDMQEITRVVVEPLGASIGILREDGRRRAIVRALGGVPLPIEEALALGPLRVSALWIAGSLRDSGGSGAPGVSGRDGGVESSGSTPEGWRSANRSGTILVPSLRPGTPRKAEAAVVERPK